MIVAIDGPAASGKSTTARGVASNIGFTHIDTGAMYRAVALHFINLELDIENVDLILSEMEKVEISFSDNDFHTILLNGKDVTNMIRDSAVDQKVSKVSALQIVRNKLVLQQRKLSKNRDIVIEGRDIGTRVFPNADFKFFLTADIEVRARRRFRENLIKSNKTPFNQILNELILRDEIDKNRKYSPLRIPDNAIILDTSNLSFKEQVKEIIRHILKKIKTKEK